MRRLLALLLIALTALTLTGCREEVDPYLDMPNPIATITMEDGRTMRFELLLLTAPNTVANFTQLANKGFYDGLEFFRVISGVLIQSGCPHGDGTGTADGVIRGEFSDNGFTNDLSHMRGVLSMARQSGYDTASSQFFIMQGNYPEYDGYYAAFGRAMDAETLDVIDEIASVPVDGYYVPMLHQVIQTIRVNTHGYELKEVKSLPLPEK